MPDGGGSPLMPDGGHDGGPPPCVPSGEIDVPDLELADTDCDGIDGAITRAVFVSAETGSDAGDGTMTMPVATIARAIEIASASGRTQVLVDAGEYGEQVMLTEGVGVFGGYDAAGDWSRSEEARALVRAAGPVLTARDLTATTTVALLRIEALDAVEPGASSIGVQLVNASGVRLEGIEIQSGRGADGTSPMRPAQPPQAATGVMGGAAVMTGTCPASWGTPATSGPVRGSGGLSSCGCMSGGRGGAAGGFRGSEPAAGDPGQGLIEGSSMCTANGGTQGRAGTGGSAGGTGGDGAAGAPGMSGMGAPPVGTFSVMGYAPASGTAGLPGVSGRGGGAGGGGHSSCFLTDFCTATGGAGGGGGAGGCGGPAGDGGGGGGASIALYLWDSTPTLVRVTLRSGDGGSGGAGARGAAGGLGGSGGPGGLAYRVRACGTGASAAGGAGGRGGAGGEGGGGGGGTGGPSIGLLLGGTSAQAGGSVAVSIAPGSGGARGLGGGSAPSGENGLSQPMLEVR